MASKKIKSLPRQTIWDLAIQEYGSIDGAFKILRDNPDLDLVNSIPANTLILISEAPLNKDVVNKLYAKGVTPANEYVVPPEILTSSAAFVFAGQNINTFSASQNYTVSATNLIANLIITAPAGFIINTDNSNVNQSPIVLAPVSGDVAATTIYVKFNPTAGQVYSGDIIHSSLGALPKSISLTGTGLAFIQATGGTETTDGNYKIHTFTGSGNFVISSMPSGATIEYLILAGGGSGATAGAGGGAGGYLTGTLTPSVQSYPVVVGAGGGTHSNGSNSSFAGIISTGGGKGGSVITSTPNTGGSGGGGSGMAIVAQPGAAGTAGQGNAGGAGQSNTPNQSAGGGGGAGGIGTNGGVSFGGAGGPGLSSSINGTAVLRGGGGGGSVRISGTAGSASAGGGAAGLNTIGTSGTTNTGGGGGGGGYDSSGTTFSGGNGGSGIIIIKYQFQ